MPDVAAPEKPSKNDLLASFTHQAAQALIDADEHALFRLLTGEPAAELARAFGCSDDKDGADESEKSLAQAASSAAAAEDVIYKTSAKAVRKQLRHLSPRPVTSIHDLCDRNGDSVLHLAAQAGHAPVLRYVYNAGLIKNDDVNECANAEGVTPLHDAVRRGRVSFARQLLFLGADPTIPDNQGKSPNSIAKKLDKTLGDADLQREMVALLRSRGMPPGFAAAAVR